MADEVETNTVAEPASGEKRYPDPYGLYQRWFDALEKVGDKANEGTLSPAELGELWRRWFEEAVGLQSGTSETENGLLNSMAPLWKEMADDLSAEMLSGESLPEDPVKFFLRWYNDTNERWSEAADELLRRDEFLESMNHFFETYARSHREQRHTSEEWLKNLYLPTRSDVARVARLVVVVENKVDRIEEALEVFVNGDSEPATAGALENLEGRMDRLEDKMDHILAALEKLVGGLDLPEARRGSSAQKDADEAVMPLEGFSLELIEAGYVGVGSQRVVEGPKTKDEN